MSKLFSDKTKQVFLGPLSKNNPIGCRNEKGKSQGLPFL